MPEVVIEETDAYRVIEATSGLDPTAQGYWRSIRTEWKAGHEPVEDILHTRAQQALAVNATYLAIVSPSAAQVAAQVRRLTMECNGLIRLVLGQLDSTAGTNGS